MVMLAQSMLEYGAISVLVDTFTNLWYGFRDWAVTVNPVWLLVPVVLYFLWRRK
ncbi:MAG TPA: hypothetical protein VMM93_06205 [Vicinamibacterales bacterium]|nr:hypothetical protein [Vicinamibacterales bacterium]